MRKVVRHIETARSIERVIAWARRPTR